MYFLLNRVVPITRGPALGRPALGYHGRPLIPQKSERLHRIRVDRHQRGVCAGPAECGGVAFLLRGQTQTEGAPAPQMCSRADLASAHVLASAHEGVNVSRRPGTGASSCRGPCRRCWRTRGETRKGPRESKGIQQRELQLVTDKPSPIMSR